MAEEIADVNQDAVQQTIRESGADILLHGHTHRPAVHPFHVDERPVHRIVLGDWYEQGSVLFYHLQNVTSSAILPRHGRNRWSAAGAWSCNRRRKSAPMR